MTFSRGGHERDEVARYAAVLGVEAARLAIHSGQSADVVLIADLGAAYRFPRTARAAADLAEDVARLRTAHRLGLPAPRVIDVVHGPIGTAHVHMDLLPGDPLPTVGSLSPSAAVTLAVDLVDLLTALASVSEPPAGLPRPVSWVQRWGQLHADFRRDLAPLLDHASQRQIALRFEAAQRAAAQAPNALVHGDLGGDNLLIDSRTGRLTGVVDWDSLCWGDPAADLASLHASLPNATRAALEERRPTSVADLERMHAYKATYPALEALLHAQQGQPDRARETVTPPA